MRPMRNTFLLLSVLLMLAACGEGETYKPQSQKDERWSEQGKLTGEGGLTLFGGKSGEESGSGGGKIGVNSYLWRASLDTLSFMPLLQTDSSGGVIVTDWYANPKNPGERVKVTVTILDQDLRADALSVAASRQYVQNGTWVEAPASAATVQQLEDIILTKARDLRRSAFAG